MKYHLSCTLLAIIFYSCNLSSGDKKPAEDSLQYYPPTPAQLNREEFRQYFRELNGFFDTTLLKGGFSGGILVAKNGIVLYEKYAGYADLQKKSPVTDSTALHIASTSKTFTAIAVLRLVQENKLSLDDSVTKFFPGFPYPGITVKMLLNHRSGLPNYLYFLSNSRAAKIPDSAAQKKYVENADVLDFLIRNKPQKSFSPGTRFSYSNTNFVLLALIIEKISGKSYPDYMQQKFFVPIGMKHTYVFTLKDTLTATPSFTNSGNYWAYDFLDGTYGDKNIYTTPRDLLKWDQALYSGQIIRPSLLDTAFTPYSLERPSIHNYGLGWRLLFLPGGKKVIYHFGKWHGFNAAFARLTDEKATIIILGNRFTRSIYSTAHLCYDFFGDYHMGKEAEPEETDSLRSPSELKTAEPGKLKRTTR